MPGVLGAEQRLLLENHGKAVSGQSFTRLHLCHLGAVNKSLCLGSFLDRSHEDWDSLPFAFPFFFSFQLILVCRQDGAA